MDISKIYINRTDDSLKHLPRPSRLARLKKLYF